MRRVLALTATVAVLTATGLVFATGADAGVSPGTGTTVRGTTTFTESPGGSDNSSILGIKHCGGNTSTQLQLINSANQVVWSTSNGGGTLTASVRTEDYANGTYTLRGTENSGANNGFGGFGCKTITATFNNTVIISNQKVLAYTGNTAAVAGTTTTVSAKVTDPNDGSSPISGQVVSFALSGGPTATATTNAAGIASTTLTVNIPPRAATLAVSSAATTFYTASDASVPFSIDKIPSGVSVTPTSPVVHGQAVSFSATVTHNPGLPATGQVQFVVDGGNFGGPVTLTGDVAQSSATSSLSTADHTVVAQYLGDTNYLASTSATATQRVDKAATGTTIASSLNPAVYGQPITFTAQVAVVAPGVGAPGGSVQFDVDGNPFGTAVPMTGASAALTIPSLGGGNHAVTATYNGNTDFASSTSAELTQGVDLAGTKVVLHSSSEPSVTGQPVSFSVDVSALPPGVGTPTGEVQFSVDGTDLGAPVTLTNGSATSASVANLAPGTHVVLADYHGSANFSGALGAFNQHVQAAATRTTVDSTPNPSVFGQPVTFDASVAVLAPGAGTPTGLVQFYVDGVASGVPVALQDGVATGVAVTELATGGHQITAIYLGDPNFAGSESGAVTQTVNRARTTTTLTSSANPSVFGQPVQLTATVGVVAPGAGNPTGHLTFTDGTTTLGVVEVGPGTNEQGSITTDALSVGSHAISVAFDGDDNFQGSGDVLTQTVHRAQTSTVVTSSVNPAKSGQAIRFFAAISPVAPGAGNPTGTVVFTVNGAPIGSPVTVIGGTATSAAFSSLSPGNYDIRAAYSGDANFVGSAAGLDQGTGLNVTPGATTMDLGSTPNPSHFGDTVTFTATVTALAPATGRPTGVVDLYDGVELLGAVSLVPGSDAGVATATFTVSDLGTGGHAIHAEYLGNYNFTGQSASLSQVVGLVPTTTGLTTAPNPSVFGGVVTLTSVVTAPEGSPTGSVTFLEGSTVLGSAALSQVQGHSQASVQVSGLGGGSHPIHAIYNGSSTHGSSTSTVVTQVVQRADTAVDADPVILTQAQLDQYGLVLHLRIGEMRATLTSGGAPLAGQLINFSTRHPQAAPLCTAVTDSNGVASCDATVNQIARIAAANGYDATFAGSADHLPSRGTGAIIGS